MPYYRYQAKDNRGRVVEGTLEAPDPNQASQSVSGRGLRLIRLTALGQPRKLSREVPRSAQTLQIHRTRYGTDKDRFFLFSQVWSYLKAGVNPAEAFARMGQNWRKAAFKESLAELGSGASEGRRISDVLASYPYLYPPHVVGIFRAGELAGVMPEACDVIARQAEESNRFRRSFWLLGILVGGMFITVPLTVLFLRGALESFKNLETEGSFMGLMRMVAKQVLWPVGPFTVALLLLAYAIYRWWISMKGQHIRHRIVLRLPTIGNRTKAESVSLFTWALGRFTSAGLAPRTAFLAAAQAMPNLELRERMESAGQAMSDSAPISAVIQSLPFLPAEAAPMIATGEMTGDLPTQLAYLERSAYGEFENENDFAKKRVGCWAWLIYCLGFLIFVYLVYCIFYGNVFQITESWQNEVP